MPKVSILTPIRALRDEQLGWLNEAIASVSGQTEPDWEMVIVDDHSEMPLRPVQMQWAGDSRVRFLTAEGDGVSAARNQAAREAVADLLLPLDADDKLAENAVELFFKAWLGKGIIYSDCVMFGRDFARVYLAPEYDFSKLLKGTFMIVGCLHSKADWQRVGGWRLDMTHGLEDWEYWIALGEMGVCGTHLAQALYWYRRHASGRLAWLRSNRAEWDRAYLAMRERHRESYAGRFGAMCCGGGGVKGARKPQRVVGEPQGQAIQAARKAATEANEGKPSTQLVYIGPKRGGFQVAGGVTRIKYQVPGTGNFVTMIDGTRGVNPADVDWFLSVARGRDYIVAREPVRVEAAPPPVQAPVAPPSFDVGIMEGKPVEKNETYPAEVRQAGATVQPAAELSWIKPKSKG